jgi:hypothetical protein
MQATLESIFSSASGNYEIKLSVTFASQRKYKDLNSNLQ